MCEEAIITTTTTTTTTATLLVLLVLLLESGQVQGAPLGVNEGVQGVGAIHCLHAPPPQHAL